ncbi:MAG: bifunctional oligoribonuclease/PAP phosphatase NrnA [Ruminococcaceae bacterium]|nr:bifunctional oligoribonuclease/PAP phosphatase NrnA [Oscillospiraceae bacterium]
MSDTATFTRLTAQAVAKTISDAESALIICHRNPDGDAVGSSFALKRIFELMGKKARVACDSPAPPYLEFITGTEDITYVQGDENCFELIVTVDTAAPSQMGNLAFLIERCHLMIDHHASGEPYAPYFLDGNAAAAGELIYKLYEILVKQGNIPRDAGVCRCLFAALSSDTGSFKFSNTTSETFRIAAMLAEEIAEAGGMQTEEISRILHDTVTSREVEINSVLSKNIQFSCEGSLAICCVTTDMMEKGGYRENELSGAVDIPKKIKGVLVAVALKQRRSDPLAFRISARSNAPIDVAAICEKFGGGGHVRAAGGTLRAPTPEAAVKTAMRAFGAAVEEYKKSPAPTFGIFENGVNK